MSKLISRISMILALSLLITLIIPQGTTHATTNETSHLTNLVIRTITGDVEEKSSYEELNGEVPSDSTPISNITFSYWEVDASDYKNLIEGTHEDVSTLPNARYINKVTTVGGEVKIPGMKKGFYWFVEEESTIIEDSHAVPFGLALPFTKEDGSGYITDLHVYPKNELAATPTIDMNVGGSNTKSQSVDIGEDIEWNILSDVPKGIENYSDYIITNKIDSKMTLDENVIVNSYNGTELVMDTDYELSRVKNAEGKIESFAVTFTEEGRKKLGRIRNSLSTDPKLKITMKSKINENAPMDESFKNTTTLEFNNGHGTKDSVDVEQPPDVYTGGRKFVVQDGQENGIKDAEFKILNGSGDFLNDDYKWVANEDEARIFTSDQYGKFEVTGLADAPYKLRQIKTKSGHVLPAEDVTFTIEKGSHSGEQPIINREITMPMTGGTGTILFTVVGLALMVFALVLIGRRRKQAE
ncbi:SpaH/EbpB family LPXTG-anchored major pilin [Salinicoccus cyprini]|nr:SpaH/EbpB family LPXTG-anchored major pilin [Salinicoccus cyprini]